MSMNPAGADGPTGHATADGWPTDDDILALAKNENIPLYAEAYAIAHQYNRISQALAAQLGKEDLSWCGFAKWSSKAIGSELRLNEHSPFFKKLTRLNHLPMLLGSPFRRLMLVLMGGSYSVGLSTANRSIFVEMASFHTQILSGADPMTIWQVEPADPERFLLKDLDDGLDLLRTARDLLRQAGSASGPARSELMLGASIALSAYEQKRVQPALEYVFYRGPRWCLQVSWRMPYYYLKGKTDKRQDFYLAPHDKQTIRMQRIEDRWVRMYSRSLWLKTAVSTIMLSKPLITPDGSNRSLLRPAAMFKSQQVAELVRQYGPPDTTKLTGVANWLDYDERMRFIVTYFMLYQQIQKMSEEPHYKQPRRSRLKARAVEPVGQVVFKQVKL